ncbi:MAG: hypothetical protein V4501_09120 [Pseudomonadota bacterium]
MSKYSKQANTVLAEVVRLLPQHGPYSSLHDIKTAFQNLYNPNFSYEGLAANKLIVEALQKEGVELTHVMEVLETHKAHCKLLQEYITTRLLEDKELTINTVVDEIRELITSENLPESAKGTTKETIYFAEISQLDTAFVFTTSRLDAVAALMAVNIPPAKAFNVVDQTHGSIIGEIPKLVHTVKGRVTNILVTIAFEQKMDEVGRVKEDLINVLGGEISQFSFKLDYEQAMKGLKELITTNLKGLNPIDFVNGLCTPEFIKEMDGEVKLAKENFVNGLIQESMEPYWKLHGNIPDAIDGMLDAKMHQLYANVFQPWKKNSTYVLPQPVNTCLPVPGQPALADSLPTQLIASNTYGLNQYKGMGIGAGGMLLAVMAYNRFATPAYENIIKPVTTRAWNACNRLGVLLFSSNSSRDRFEYNNQTTLLPMHNEQNFKAN